MAKKIANATANVKEIALKEFPEMRLDQPTTMYEVLDILHVVDVHRQQVENKRADVRNSYRLTMLYVTLGLWVLSAFTLKLILPLHLYVVFSPFTAVVPLIFDLTLQHINKHQKV